MPNTNLRKARPTQQRGHGSWQTVGSPDDVPDQRPGTGLTDHSDCSQKVGSGSGKSWVGTGWERPLIRRRNLAWTKETREYLTETRPTALRFHREEARICKLLIPSANTMATAESGSTTHTTQIVASRLHLEPPYPRHARRLSSILPMESETHASDNCSPPLTLKHTSQQHACTLLWPQDEAQKKLSQCDPNQELRPFGNFCLVLLLCLALLCLPLPCLLSIALLCLAVLCFALLCLASLCFA
jgi:hypothetical protein